MKELFEKWYGFTVCDEMDIQTEVAWKNWQAAYLAGLKRASVICRELGDEKVISNLGTTMEEDSMAQAWAYRTCGKAIEAELDASNDEAKRPVEPVRLECLVRREELTMKPYMVEIRTYGVVMAEDEAHARSVAESYKRDIFSDDWNPYIEVDGEVSSVDALGHGWDGECIPYGGDGNTRLSELLAPIQDGQERQP